MKSINLKHHLMGLFLSQQMYFSGTLRLLSSLIFSSFIFSTRTFWASQFSTNFLLLTSLSFLDCSLSSSWVTICFLSSFACFFRSAFLSFSSCSSIYFSSFCFLTAASNSAFQAFACSSSRLSFSICCSILASCSSCAFLFLISASALSFSLAARQFASTARLALSASSYACLSEAFSCSSLSLWISFYFSSLMRLNKCRITFAKR